MHNFLLLGAGFSRIWGGWLANEVLDYLLGCPEVQEDKYLCGLLWDFEEKGGFEAALTELQVESITKKESSKIKSLSVFYSALSNMFSEMDEALNDLPDFEFNQFRGKHVKTFLARFEAIFTLNQDVLLERYYLDQVYSVTSPGRKRWDGFQIPGMRKRAQEAQVSKNFTESIWDEIQPLEIKIKNNFQPYYKLHGSCNWKSTKSENMMIMGSNKEKIINEYPVLKRYHKVFKENISQTNTKLMIIGYGFGDAHINTAICEGVEKNNLKIFIIDKLGDKAPSQHRLKSQGIIGMPITPIEEAVKKAFIGSSTRSLPKTFGDDPIEFGKIMKFFS